MKDRNMTRRFENRADISFRPIGPKDEPFLYQLYASTREDVAALDWDPAQKASFIQSQFMAQHTQYQQNYTNATFDLIVFHAQPVGRLYIERRRKEIRIVDIALLPAYRNTGIGTVLLKEILAEAGRGGKSVTIHVQSFNPALKLYERLGFIKIEDVGVYYLMEWKARIPS